ncbi:hypothetical protein [Ferrovibrio sp.]|uniref:hypothetical protein n=1 Tax=Ferrovibrio sp. TaxID=1917215 RepID=UPI00262CA040|nr:hypothetical protein [Ferrovibrio sp.]
MNPYAALGVAILLAGLAAPGMASDAAKKPKTIGEKIEICMQQMERGHTAGRRMTPQQRMTAEAQCRARAESETVQKNS